MGSLRYAVIFALATAAGTAAALPVYVLGLVAPMTVVWPLTLAVMALVVGLVAGWAGNLLYEEASCTRLAVVVGVAEATAAVLVAVSAVPMRVPELLFAASPAVYGLALASAVISINASMATYRYRRPVGGRLRRDMAVSVALVLLALPGAYGLAALSCSLLVRCGA